MITLILVDDHELVRTGLKRLLNDFEHISVIGEADNGNDAIALVKQHEPDVAILDINMPGLNGIETTRKLHRDFPNVKILIVSMHNDDLFPQRLLNAGADGYLTKDCKITEIIHAIDVVMNNNNYICVEVSLKLALINTGVKKASLFHDLSERELQVLILLINGMKLNDISEKLCLSPKTVGTYRQRLLIKLEVKNDVELVKLALRHGLIDEMLLS